jgi:hypothetical protein
MAVRPHSLPRPAASQFGSPDERTANVRHWRQAQVERLIDRIREPGGGLRTRIRPADVTRPALAG